MQQSYRKHFTVAAAIILTWTFAPLAIQADNIENIRSEELTFKMPAAVKQFSPKDHRDQWPPDDGDVANGHELAERLCGTIRSSRAASCRAIVTRSRHFSVRAVLACGQVREDSEKLRCINTIADHEITGAEADRCVSSSRGAHDQDRAIVDCLSDAVNRRDPYDPRGRWDKPGLNAASKICYEMRYENDMQHCLMTIASARYYSLGAVDICDKRYHPEQKTECLARFKDLYLSPQAVMVCADIPGTPNRHRTNDENKIACLLAGSSTRRFDWGPSEDPAGMQEAVNLCRSIRDHTRKADCTGVIAQARNFYLETIDVCHDMISDGYKIQCLDALRDAKVGRYATRACLRIDYEPEKIACLRKLARNRN